MKKGSRPAPLHYCECFRLWAAWSRAAKPALCTRIAGGYGDRCILCGIVEPVDGVKDEASRIQGVMEINTFFLGHVQTVLESSKIKKGQIVSIAIRRGLHVEPFVIRLTILVFDKVGQQVTSRVKLPAQCIKG